MKPIKLPEHYNYIEAYLTYKCPLSCTYCINRFNTLKSVGSMSATDWIEGLNRIEARADLPITLGGGEPTFHKDFYKIVRGVNKPMDLLTNLQFVVEGFVYEVPPDKFKRGAPYASIRVSFHPEQMAIKDTVEKVRFLLDKGYEIGIWMVNHPDYAQEAKVMGMLCKGYKIDFRMKEYLGVDVDLENKMFFKGAVGQNLTKECWCKPSELLIAPDGSIHRCHRDLYAGESAYSHILDKRVELLESYTHCINYGHCNPCDIKGPKFNRFQQKVHCAVEIKNTSSNKRRE